MSKYVRFLACTSATSIKQLASDRLPDKQISLSNGTTVCAWHGTVQPMDSWAEVLLAAIRINVRIRKHTAIVVISNLNLKVISPMRQGSMLRPMMLSGQPTLSSVVRTMKNLRIASAHLTRLERSETHVGLGTPCTFHAPSAWRDAQL